MFQHIKEGNYCPFKEFMKKHVKLDNLMWCKFMDKYAEYFEVQCIPFEGIKLNSAKFFNDFFKRAVVTLFDVLKVHSLYKGVLSAYDANNGSPVESLREFLKIGYNGFRCFPVTIARIKPPLENLSTATY